MSDMYTGFCPLCSTGSSGVVSNAGNVVYFKCHNPGCRHQWAENHTSVQLKAELDKAHSLLRCWLDTMIEWKHPIIEETENFLNPKKAFIEQARKDFCDD